MNSNHLLWDGWIFRLDANNDIVNRNVNKFHEETDEAHDGEADCRCYGDLLKFWKRNNSY